MARGKVYADPDPTDRDPAPGDNAQTPETLDWLKGEELKVAEQMTQLWLDQTNLPQVKQAEARWQANELRRDGYTGVRVIKNKDQNSYKVWIPMGGKANSELVQEARRLCRAFVGNLMADPPASQVFPVDTGEDDRDTSDVSERALSDLQAERRLNTPGKVRDALDTSCTYGSGYIVYTVDQTAGGRVARTMQASPLAMSPDAPLTDPQSGMPYAPPAEMIADPMTPGALTQGPQGPPPDPVERLVHENQKQFTDDPQQAAYDWQKDLRSEVLSGRHVRLLPYTVENIWESHGVMVATFQPWKRIKGMFPDLAKLDEQQTKELLDYRPQGADKLLPNKAANNKTQDSAMVFCLMVCYQECGDYKDGFYGIAIGGKRVPWRQPWVSYASGKREALLLPVSQCKLFRNGKTDYNGDSLMDDLGGIGEVMAAQIGHALAYLDWFNNPQVFVPMHSNIQDQDILSRKPIIRILPGGEPKSLDPPRYPEMSMTVYEYMKDAGEKASHLMEAAQGVEDPSVKSGRHAYQIVAQAHAQLSEPKQNIERCYVRCSEIELQYARAFGLEGEAKWTGEDGDFKVKRWQGADLAGDVRLKPGTMTMLSPAAKAQLVEQWMSSMIISPEEGKEMLANGIGATIGMRDEPAKLEIRRQIQMWEEGPPQGWMPPPPMMPGAPMSTTNPTAPQQVGLPPEQALMPPPDPALDLIWQPRVHHELPGIAQLRLTELARFMSTRKFSKQPREWQSIVEQECQRMMQLAAPPMPAPVGKDGKPVESEQPSNGMPPLDNPVFSGKAA